MLPKVAIVGRPNVGKSSLLNLLAGRLISIVDPTAGVTRDRVTVDVELPPTEDGGKPRWCEMIDTGGYGIYSGDDENQVLTDDVEHQIGTALTESQLILFVVDVQTGVVPLDEQFATILREQVSGRVPILMVGNKVDSEQLENDAVDAMRLGFGEPVTVSATTKRGRWELIETIADAIDWDAEPAEPERSDMLLAIVGKRNAGKSTFTNALAGAERVIASELPGTTRDSVDVKFTLGDRSFTAIDTAGVRKRKSLANDVEYYSTHRTLRSIRRADVVLLMIDPTTDISQVDKKLSGAILEHHKPCVIVLNKWDLVASKLSTEEFLDYLTDMLKGLDFCPVVFASALNNDHVSEAVEMALALHEQASTRVGTGELNAAVKKILEKRGPSSKLGKRVKIYYVTQPETNPPTAVLFVNDADLFTPQYQRYIVNNFREMLPWKEVPIRLIVRGRTRKEVGDEEPLVEL